MDDWKFKLALEYGVEVLRAKFPEDIAREGLHLINPTEKAVLEAVILAMKHGVKMVIVHAGPISPDIIKKCK